MTWSRVKQHYIGAPRRYAPLSQSITVAESSPGSYDRGVLSALPPTFGSGEFTFSIFFRCLSNATYSLNTISGNGLSNIPLERQYWAANNPSKYASFDWWYHGNFLIDGHNNTSGRLDEGTFSLQIAAGRPRWTFSDGTAEVDALNGDMYAVQSTATETVLDNAWHQVDLVRRWSGGSSADLELWLDGSLQDTVTIANRVDMTAFWDTWANYPTNEGNWAFGTEKQASLGVLVQWEDFKGEIGEIRFWGAALSSGVLANDFTPVQGNETNLLEVYRWTEQTGTTCAGDLGNGGDITLSGGPTWSTASPF